MATVETPVTPTTPWFKEFLCALTDQTQVNAALYLLQHEKDLKVTKKGLSIHDVVKYSFDNASTFYVLELAEELKQTISP